MTGSRSSHTSSAFTAHPVHGVSTEPPRPITLPLLHPVTPPQPLHPLRRDPKTVLLLASLIIPSPSSSRPLVTPPDSTPREMARRLSPTPLFPKS